MLGIPASSTYNTNFHQYTGHYNIGLIRDFILVFFRIAHDSCGCTLAPTKQMANELKSLGFKNTGGLFRGVDTELDTLERRDFQLRSEWGAKENDYVFTYVGRVASEKNIDLAVQSYLLARGGGLHCGVGWASPVPLYNLRYSVGPALASFARKSIQAG